MTRNPILAVMAAGLVALSVLAVPVLADESEHRDGAQERRDAAEERREAAEEQREVRRERMAEAKDAWKEHCQDNETLNETQQKRCMAVKGYAEHAFKARREAHALLGAIDAMERRIGRLEVREIALQAELDSGNFTGNHTAESVQDAIDKIQEHQDRIAERIAHLKEKLAALHEKWSAVREHVQERRHRGMDADDDSESESESESESQSDSESESESESESQSDSESESESSSSSSPPA